VITFSQIAEAARMLSSAEGGEKQPSGHDVLVMRFTGDSMKRAMANALRPLEGYAVPVPYRVYGVRTSRGDAYVDVEIRLDCGAESER